MAEELCLVLMDPGQDGQRPVCVCVFSQSRRAEGEPYFPPCGSAGLLPCLLRESQRVCSQSRGPTVDDIVW